MNNFEEHLKQYLQVPENDRFWLGGIYSMTEKGIENYKPFKFNSNIMFELVGTTGEDELEFQMNSVGKMIEIVVQPANINNFFELDIDETQKVYEKEEN